MILALVVALVALATSWLLTLWLLVRWRRVAIVYRETAALERRAALEYKRAADLERECSDSWRAHTYALRQHLSAITRGSA